MIVHGALLRRPLRHRCICVVIIIILIIIIIITDVTVVDALANSYTPTTSVISCGAAEAAATRKRAKYAEIIQSHHFVPIAIETLEPINMDGQRFLDSLGERLSSISGDPRETTSLYQRLSVLVPHPNFQCGCLSWFSPSRDSYRRLTPELVFNFCF